MDFLYPLLIAFILVFISELGDKTQLLVLSFSSKLKPITILIGVALGSLLSHGIAILFGSLLGNIENEIINTSLKIITYLSFLILGLINLFFRASNSSSGVNVSKNKVASYSLNYILLIASTIAIGELGDKTFLASIGLGIQYYNYKVSLIIGAILGMILSDTIAILLGKYISKKVPDSIIENFSGILFLIFGLVGIINFIF